MHSKVTVTTAASTLDKDNDDDFAVVSPASSPRRPTVNIQLPATSAVKDCKDTAPAQKPTVKDAEKQTPMPNSTVNIQQPATSAVKDCNDTEKQTPAPKQTPPVQPEARGDLNALVSSAMKQFDSEWKKRYDDLKLKYLELKDSHDTLAYCFSELLAKHHELVANHHELVGNYNKLVRVVKKQLACPPPVSAQYHHHQYVHGGKPFLQIEYYLI